MEDLGAVKIIINPLTVIIFPFWTISQLSFEKVRRLLRPQIKWQNLIFFVGMKRIDVK